MLNTDMYAIPGFSFFCNNVIDCEDGGMCGLTVTSSGSPAEGMGDCFHLHCQAGR